MWLERLALSVQMQLNTLAACNRNRAILLAEQGATTRCALVIMRDFSARGIHHNSRIDVAMRTARAMVHAYRMYVVDRLSLDELSKRHQMLYLRLETPAPLERELLEQEFAAVGKEIMWRTADCGSV